MSIYKKMLDGVEPRESAEELAQKVLSGERERPRSAKPLAAAAAGIAAAAALTVTAAAAVSRDLGSVISAWFGTRNEESYSEKLIKVENVEQTKNSFEGLEFEVKGAVADDIFVTVFLDVTRTDGGIFDCNEYFIEIPPEYGKPYPEKPFHNLFGEAEPVSRSADYGAFDYFGSYIPFTSHVMDDGDPNDECITLALTMDAAKLKKASGGDVADIDLRIDSLRCSKCVFVEARRTGEKSVVIVTDNVEMDEFKGEAVIRMELPLASGKSKKLRPDTQVEMLIYPHTNDPDELINIPYSFTLTDLEVSSAAVRFVLEGEPTDERYYPSMNGDIVRVNLKDGSSFALDANMPHNGMTTGGTKDSAFDRWRISCAIAFGRIIDVDDIVSVEIGGKTIELPDA